ncbi:MAG: PAS domain S-box protein [Syntrophomonadaceae bacterium]|nr:PAS domain S-box protein [Syntrophomonadaceae bacterium]
MIDEQDLETRLKPVGGKTDHGRYGPDNVPSLLPAGILIASDVTCNELRHNPATTQLLSIPALFTNSSLAYNVVPIPIYPKDKEIFTEAVPTQRAAWLGEGTWEEEFEYSWNNAAPNHVPWGNSKPLYGDDDMNQGVLVVCEDINPWKKVYKRLKAPGKVLKKTEAQHTENSDKARREVEEEITRHLKIERGLSLAKAAETKVFQYSPDSISITSLKEGRYIQVNKAFTVLSGYEHEELIGFTDKELGVWVYPEEREMMITQINRDGAITNFEMHFRTKTGRILICLVSGGTIEIDGEIHIIGIIKDITQRKHYEEKLSISEERFSKAFNFSPYPMCISTMQGGRFIEVNESFCLVTGYSSNELISSSVLRLGLWLKPGDRRLVREKIRQEGSVRDFETVFRAKGGENLLIIYNAERIEVQNTPCIFSVIMDITEKKKSEVELLRLDRLNLAGEMATSIGHEIRNPMTAVRGYLQLLMQNEKYSPELEYFDLMIEELDKANLIITEFLSLAKNKLIELKPANINSIINQLLPLAQAKALLRDQQIEAELGQLPDQCLDYKEVSQLILNLVQNGLESMTAGGKITIKTYVEAENIVLAVEDRGYGIKPQDIAKLGTPFFTTKDTGTGLGLAVCYRIAAHHNAKIEVETGSAGTTFYVKFPGN